MLISSQSDYCLEGKMETLKNKVPKMGKNVARKSTSNRPLKNIPSVKPNDIAFSSAKIVELTQSQNTYYANLESMSYSSPPTYHLSNSARYSDHLYSKPGLIQESFVDNSEEECDNIDGVFSISGSMLKFEKVAQMSPLLSEDSDDGIDPNRVHNFPVKYEFPSFAFKQYTPPRFSDSLFPSGDGNVSDSNLDVVQANSTSTAKKTPVTPIKNKLSIKKELFRDSNEFSDPPCGIINNEEPDNEYASEQAKNGNETYLKIEYVTTLTPDNDITLSENVSHKEANREKSLESHVKERIIETEVYPEINAGSEMPEAKEVDKQGSNKTNIDQIIEDRFEDKVIESNIGKNKETIIDKPVIKTEGKSVEPIEEKPVINQESNNSDESCDKTVTADEKALIVNKTKKEKEPVPKKKNPMSIKGKVNKQNKKTLMLPTRPTRSTMIHFVDETIDDSFVKRVSIDRKTKKPKGTTPSVVTKRARPFSNRRSKANLNLAEDSSDNSDSNCSSSEATENKAVKEKTKNNDAQRSKSDNGLKKSKSESVEDLKSDVLSNSEKPKDPKKSIKIKPEINEGILLHVEAAKKTNIMRDGKILKDKKDLLKDVDSTIDKNLPLEVDKQGFEIQQSLTEEILLDQALRLAHQRTSPRRRPLLTTSQAKEIVNSLTSQTRAGRKSTEKKSSNSSESPGKQTHETDSNLIEADLSTTAETESDNELKQVPSIGKTSSSPVKSESPSNSKQQEKKTSKPKKINIKSILKKMADSLDTDDMDINSLSKTFEDVIKNITSLSNSEASDSDNLEEKKVVTRTKKKTKTKSRKKTKSNFTQEDFSINKSTLPVNNLEDLIPVIIIKNKSEAILRERSQRISNSDSSKEDSIAAVIPEEATNLEPPTLVPEVETSMQDPPTNIPKLEPCLLDHENVKHPKNISSETTSIPQNNTEDSAKGTAVVTSEDPYIQKVTTSGDLHCEKKKLILDESCRSLIIDESLNETSLNVECKSLTISTPLSESSNDEVTSTTEIDKTENSNKEESTIIIEDSPASPDEISEPLPDSKKSTVIEIIEIEDEVHSSTKIVEPKIPFLDNCDSTESEKDFSKDNSPQLSFNSASSDSNKATLHTPEFIDGIPTKGGKLSEVQENTGSSTSYSSNDTLPEEEVEKTPLLSNPEITVPSTVPNVPTSSIASLVQASSAASTNPAVYTNVTSGSNISSPINIFSQPHSNSVYSLSSDATQITTSIVTTSTLLQHISQQSLTSSINLRDPVYNPAHLANYFNQTKNLQYPLSTNSLQYSSTSSSSSDVTQLAQPNATSSSTIVEQSKPKPKSIDVPLSILARDPRLRKKSVRIIVDNVEFTTPVSSSNPSVPSISSDPRGLVTPRVPSASTASGTPKIQAVAPFSKQKDNEETEPDESGSVSPENVDNSEEGNEKAESPVHEVPKKKTKKKEIDKELLYKTPLCDLHEETSERSSYTRKPKRPAPSRFESHRPSKFERSSYSHHDPYREPPNRNYKISETDHFKEIINGHYTEESHEYVSAAIRRPGEKLEGYRRKEEFPHHSRRPDHFSRRDYEDTRRRDTSDRRPLLEHGFGGRFNNRYKEYSLDQSTDYKYRRTSNNYPRYDYAHKKVDGKFPSHYEPEDVDEDGQSSSRPYYRRRHLHGNDGFSSTQKKDEEELFRRRWEENGEDWKLRRALLDDSPPFSRSRSVERPHGPGRGLELESPLSPDI